jgi:hypothetical protein
MTAIRVTRHLYRCDLCAITTDDSFLDRVPPTWGRLQRVAKEDLHICDRCLVGLLNREPSHAC